MKKRGFSLLELLFALVIVSTVLAIAIPRFQKGFELQLKTTSRKLSSGIRYGYFQAVSTNRYYRLVLSLDRKNGDTYWLEYADKPVMIRSQEKEEERERRLQSVSEEEREALLKREAVFTRVEENLANNLELPSGVHFKDVYVDHQSGKIENGLAYLYFFPNGYTERAVINLEDNDGIVYSLEILPLTAKTRIRVGYWDYAENS